MLQIIIRVTVIPMKASRSRSREFTATRSHYPLSPDIKTSRSHSRIAGRRASEADVLCVGCFNHQLQKDKRKRIKHEMDELRGEAERSVDKGLGGSITDRSKDKQWRRREEEVRKMNDYNLKKMLEERKVKEEAKKQVKKEWQEQKNIQNKVREEKQQKIRLQQQQRDKLKNQLQQQITFAKQRHRQDEQDRIHKTSFEPLIKRDIKDISQQKNAALGRYKNQLMQQINQKRARQGKMKQIYKKQDKENQLPFVLQAEDRRTKADRLREEMKQQLSKSRRKMQQERRNVKAEEKYIRRQEEQQRKQLAQVQLQQQKEEEDQRRSKINSYLKDLRKQIAENEQKREQEFKRVKDIKVSQSSLTLGKKTVTPNKECSCCHKNYPGRELASYRLISEA